LCHAGVILDCVFQNLKQESGLLFALAILVPCQNFNNVPGLLHVITLSSAPTPSFLTFSLKK
jgi:hypothetical protein